MAKNLRVLNQTRNHVLVEQGSIADTVWTRGKGLLAHSHLEEGDGLWIVPCYSIHSFFMQFSFDAIFLNRKHQVVFLMESMPPWRVSPLVWKAHSVLELPAGAISRSQTQVGDELQFEEKGVRILFVI